MRLRDALAALSSADLRALAQANDVLLGANPIRQDVIDQLARRLMSGAVIAAMLASVGQDERRGLDELVANAGVMPARLFERDYGTLIHRNAYPFEDTRQRPVPTTPTSNLYYAGLIFPAYGRLDKWEGQVLVIPEEILAHLPKVSKTQFADVLLASAEPAERNAQGDLVRDIGMLLCYLQRGSVRAVRGNQLPKRDVVRLNADMSMQEDMAETRTEQDTLWISFVHHCADILGLVQVQGGLIVPSDGADGWLAQTIERQTWDAWRAFLKDTTYNEVEQSVSPNYAYSFSARVLAAREHVLAALKHCLPLRWYTIESFSQAMKLHDPFFLRARGGSMASVYWDTSSFYGSWTHLEADLIKHMLSSSLAAFNVVETGTLPGGEAQRVFHLTARGALFLGLISASIDPPASPPIVVQPNFEIIVPRETTPHTIFRLQRFASLQKNDRASIYSLSAQSIWRYLQAGGDVQKAIKTLERAAGRPVPQNVAYSMTEWAARHGEVTLERVDLLRTRSDALMAELRANRKLSLAVGEELSKSAVTLLNAAPGPLIDMLRKAGYWPKAGQGVAGSAPSTDVNEASLAIATGDLVNLLGGALVLAAIMDDYGWRSPVPEATIRRLLERLSPALTKRVRTIAQAAIARYGASAADDESLAPDRDERWALPDDVEPEQ